MNSPGQFGTQMIKIIKKVHTVPGIRYSLAQKQRLYPCGVQSIIARK